MLKGEGLTPRPHTLKGDHKQLGVGQQLLVTASSRYLQILGTAKKIHGSSRSSLACQGIIQWPSTVSAILWEDLPASNAVLKHLKSQTLVYPEVPWRALLGRWHNHTWHDKGGWKKRLLDHWAMLLWAPALSTAMWYYLSCYGVYLDSVFWGIRVLLRRYTVSVFWCELLGVSVLHVRINIRNLKVQSSQPPEYLYVVTLQFLCRVIHLLCIQQGCK